MKTLVASIAIVLACASTAVFAADKVDGSGLSAEQTAKAQLYIESLKKSEQSGASEAVRKEVSAWSDLGSNLGKGIVAAAKEMGTAASDFAVTPLGKVVTFVLLFKLVGKSVIGLFLGVAIISLGVSIALKLWTGATKYNVEYAVSPRVTGWPIFGQSRVLQKRELLRTDGEEMAVAIVCFVLSLGGGVWCILGNI